MGIRDALQDGTAEVRRAWPLVVLAYGLNLVLVLPLAASMAHHLSASLGHSIAAENLRRGWDDLWHRGFAVEAKGLAATFDAGVVGIGAVFRALDDLLDGSLLDLHPTLVITGLVYLVAWVFLGGGLLARFLERAEPRGFLAQAARHFPRMLGISAVAWILYLGLLRILLPALGDVVDAATSGTVDERVHFAWVVVKYAVVWMLVWSVSLVADYTKIAAIVGGPGRSIGMAMAAGLRTVLRHRAQVFGLSLALGMLGALVVFAYRVVAPGAAHSNGFQIGIAFMISQTYVLAKVFLRCLLLASQAKLGRDLLTGSTSGK